MPRILPSRQILTRHPHSSSPLFRFNSTQAASKPVSPHVGFYKTFTRPVAKVLLMATFFYQVSYWAWVKLEHDEIKAARNAEITGLENQLEALTRGKKEDQKERD